MTDEFKKYCLSKEYIKYAILSTIRDEEFISDFNINDLKNINISKIKSYDRYLNEINDNEVLPVFKKCVSDLIEEFNIKMKKAKLLYLKLNKLLNQNTCITKKIMPIIFYNNGSDPEIEVTVAHIPLGQRLISKNGIPYYFKYSYIRYILDTTRNSVKVLVDSDEGPEIRYIDQNLADFIKNVETSYKEHHSKIRRR